MLSDELLRKVHLIELSTRKMVDEVMTGQYRSQFKGQGMTFSEHRLYVDGDDVRHIDWKVSARTSEAMLKKYEEERELTVFLIVDISASKGFGSSKIKSEAAAEIAGMLSYAAMHSGDKVGALLFGGEVELIVPPKKGKQHGLRIIRDVLTHQPRTKGTDLKAALESASRVMKHSGIVFIVSDFLAEGYETQLRRLARKHDVIAVSIGDQRELEMPDVGNIIFSDPETGVERFVDTSSYAFKRWHEEFLAGMQRQTDAAMKGGRVEFLRVKTHEDYADAVVRFFRRRAKMRKRK